MSEKLKHAFEGLLDTMAEEPPPPSNTSLECQMGSGLLSLQDSRVHSDAIAGSDNDPDQSSEDPQENFVLISDGVSCIASLFKKRATL